MVPAQAATQIVVLDAGCVLDVDTLQDLERARMYWAGS